MMMRESVLEFRLGSELYCFNAKIVKYVFDLEEYEEVEGVDDAVCGLVRYDDDAMLLIDTLYLYTQKDHMELDGSKSVVVIEDENEALYGMLVDEIVKIEDVEPAPSTLDLSSEELVIHHYKENDKLVNEVVPLPLLHAKQIPSFRKMDEPTSQDEEIAGKERDEFLLFKIDDKLFAVDTAVVKEVVEKEKALFELAQKSTYFKGAVAVRDDVYKVANIKPEVKEGSELVVVQSGKERFCIEADAVFGIEYFQKSKIDTLVDIHGYIYGFYNKDGEIVAIINEKFFISQNRKKEDAESRSEDTKNVGQNSTRKGFLIFNHAHKEFAFDMDHVRQVLEKEDMPHTDSAAMSTVASSHIAFITEWNHHGVEVLALDKFIGVESKDEPLEVIMIEEGEKVRGVLVEKVDDIYYAKMEDIALSENKDALIEATLLKDEKLIAVLNPSRVVL